MFQIKLRLTTPRRIDPEIRALLRELDLDERTVVRLPLHRTKSFKPQIAECHLNAWIQCKFEGGSTSTGWTLWQDRMTQFVEAQFHTVWVDKRNCQRDITPRQDKEREVFFVPDPRLPVRVTRHAGQPALIVFANVSMQSGRLIKGIEEQVRVLNSSLVEEHALNFGPIKPEVQYAESHRKA